MIYDNIKIICKKKNLSIRSLEHAAELGNGTISKWNEVNPTLENIQAVARVLDVSVDELSKPVT